MVTPPCEPHAPRTPPAPDGSPGSNARAAFDAIAFALGFLAYLYLAGWLIDRVRLSSARLPAYLVSDAFTAQRLIGDGLRTTLLAGVVFALVCVLAYFAAALRWGRNGPFWHEQIAKRADTRADGPRAAPLGEAAMRILAGLSSVSLAAFVGLMAAQLIDALFPSTAWAVLLAWLLAFLPSLLVIEILAPRIWGGRMGGWLWAPVVLLSLFASAPLGVLILATVFVATFGRLILRLERPRTIAALVRSPLPWALLVVVTMVALAYNAMPPESFPTAVLTTPSGQQTGAYLGRTGDGVYLASCSVAQTDATSTKEHVSFTPARAVQSLEVRSEPYRFDSAKRPSLLTLAFHAIGGEGDTPTWFDADLRARASTCDGAGTEGVANDPALGKGVLVAPGPPGARARDGEQPIQDTAAHLIAELARRYEPTVLVTAADRNWPVSLGAVLAERGAGGEKACLVQKSRPKPNCDVTAQDLVASGSSEGDYLQLPVKLEDDSTPEGQFGAFMRGQELEPGPPGRWLKNPALLEPWSTAQIYFYLSAGVDTQKLPEKARNPLVPPGLVGLEYWFYYPYNYYPLIVRAKLMERAPLAGEVFDVDRHQGDWEHVDVLLDPRTFEPKWLYMARHDFEGEFIRWKNAALDGDHPLVQAAYGGHPSYRPGCAPQARTRAFALLTDWLVCGSGRLGFRGQSTPLVDLATVPWACWPGHFGEAGALEIGNAKMPEDLRDKLKKVKFVAGPGAPLRQAENKGVCVAAPQASEEHLLPRLQTALGKPPAAP